MKRPLAPGSRLSSTGVYTRAGTLVIDLREVAWVDPVHLVSVAAVAEAARRDGLKFRLQAPSAPQRARYAARMRLGDVVESLGGEHDLPTVDDDGGAENLVEVAVLRAPSDVWRLAELVHERVRDLDSALAHALHQGVSEIGENVCMHARSVGYVAAQTIPRRGELRFAVADPGVGLRTTLADRGADSDRAAIELALAGVSRTDHGGTGVRADRQRRHDPERVLLSGQRRRSHHGHRPPQHAQFGRGIRRDDRGRTRAHEACRWREERHNGVMKGDS